MSCSWSQRKNFQLFTIDYDVSCGFVINSHYYIQMCSFCTNYDKSFCHEWMLNFIRYFFYVYDYVIFILPFVNVVFYIDWFTDIGSSLYPWKNPCLIMCVIFLYIIEISLLILCWGFLRLYSSEMLPCNFLFLEYLCFFLVSAWWWHCRMNLGVFIPL